MLYIKLKDDYNTVTEETPYIMNNSTLLKLQSQLIDLRSFYPNQETITRKEVDAYLASSPDKKLAGIFYKHHEMSKNVFTTDDVEITTDDVPKVFQPTAIAAVITSPINELPIPMTISAPLSTVSNSAFTLSGSVPTQKSHYVPWGNYKDVERLIASNKFFALYLTGDSGTGKDIMIEQACAKLGRPMIRIQITRETKEDHLIGSKTLVDGNIVYEDGPIVWAAKAGAVVNLSEISAGDANELLCLQNVLEGGEFFVKSANKWVKPAPGFCVIASDNTKGMGSDSGKFIGTNILNSAFLERFKMTMEQKYPPISIEREILTKEFLRHKSEVDTKFIEELSDWVAVIRKTYLDEGIDEQITTRRACHIVDVHCNFFPVDKSIKLCTARFDDTTQTAFLSLWEKMKTGEIKNDAVEVASE